MIDAIEECIDKNPKKGYKTTAEFVKVAVNQFLDEMCPNPETAQRHQRMNEVIKRLERLEKRE